MGPADVDDASSPVPATVDGGTVAERSWWGRLRSDRAAAWVFGAYLVVAFPLLLFVLGGDRWFLRDDWTFLSTRTLTDGGQLLDDHYGHWTTLPIIAFRLMWLAVGARSYLPYEAMVIVVHLVTCVLLRMVMRRSGVGAWIATATAATFVLFGAGEQNITWAFQITMGGSVAFGLAALLVLDHDGRPSWRDAGGLALGAASLMCSGIGPLMVVGISTGLLVRRGWRRAALTAVPLAALYGLWHLTVQPEVSQFDRPDSTVVVDWVRSGTSGVFQALVGDHLVLALLLAAGTVAGLVLAVVDRSPDPGWRTVGVPVGLLVVLPLLFASASLRGWIFGDQMAAASRYLHVAAAALLPAIALAADALARRHAAAGVALLVPLAVGVPSNVDAFNSSVFGPAYFDQSQVVILGAVASPVAEDVPSWVQPDLDPTNGGGVTMGWLLQSKDEGRIPDPPPMDDLTAASATLRIAFTQPPGDEPLADCERVPGPLVLDLEAGDRIQLLTQAQATMLDGDEAISAPIVLKPQGSGTFVVTVPSLRVRLVAVNAFAPALACLP